ncbi:hypothetical protein [Streptococcus suis]|uniref:hypothetical protein n=1 Tax=Streptococcus suis TaxID=1307 RepID=UPI000CF5320D|nr:hypothetical protein [Streptococcus suis]HEL2402616.1 hypothetical protein [Streptococcus suis]HEL9633492.1 hypothetical protein [Streptococcus suis]
MKIQVDRTSVCMGDDVLPHSGEIDIPSDITVTGLIKFLEAKTYLPSIRGNNVVWQILNNGSEVAAYFTKNHLITNANLSLKSMIDKSGNNFLFFKYYTSPESYRARKEKHT